MQCECDFTSKFGTNQLISCMNELSLHEQGQSFNYYRTNCFFLFTFFQSDTLLSFLTIRESLTYTALLTLKRCSNYSIKKKVCILQSSTRKAGRMSCDVFPSSTFHPWLFFMFMRFCKWGEILLVRSRTQALWWSHLFKGFVQVPQGITIMLGQNPST